MITYISFSGLFGRSTTDALSYTACPGSSDSSRRASPPGVTSASTIWPTCTPEIRTSWPWPGLTPGEASKVA
jgi:hypothetical protein